MIKLTIVIIRNDAVMTPVIITTIGELRIGRE